MPDLTIKGCKPEGMLKSEVMIFADAKIYQDEDSDEDTKDNDLPCSQDNTVSARIQIAQQMINLKPYIKRSFLLNFEKVGESVGALRNLLACDAFRKYVMGKEVKSLVAKGLHIHRSVAIFHIKVTMRHNETMLIYSS